LDPKNEAEEKLTKNIPPQKYFVLFLECRGGDLIIADGNFGINFSYNVIASISYSKISRKIISISSYGAIV
jgi:hypothetical protein